MSGLSLRSARQRAALVSNVRYDLAFRIPASIDEPVTGRASVAFDLADASQPLALDTPPGQSGRSARSAGLRPGANSLDFAFTCADAALNRRADLLYTLFVPAHAHRVFPCFDQPDLKARFTLALTHPPNWTSVSNGEEAGRTEDRDAVTVRFAETRPIPTYLFAFAAGRLLVETAVRDGRTWRMFHRETDAARVARNRDAVFDLLASSLAWLEEYTGSAAPFPKCDIVLVPSFQFGGMEHPGAIFFDQDAILLDASATEDQAVRRATLIAHELAHLWFGDLVTMRWFDDVWLKEVFATFLAAKIANPSFPAVNHDLQFLVSNVPAAYGVDRTAGTHPIRQPLEDLDEAWSQYGPIIYNKAPIVMRQLERLIGAGTLRDGLRAYLDAFRFGNADWPDLVKILDTRTPVDLAAWSRTWIESSGRPATDAGVEIDARGIVSRLDYVQPDGGGLVYGDVRLDAASRAHLLARLEDLPDPVARAATWIVLWEEMLAGRTAPSRILDAARRAMPRETAEPLVQMVLGYMRSAFWTFLPPSARLAEAPKIETLLRRQIEAASTSSLKSAYFSALRSMALTTDALSYLVRVWRRDESIAGLTLGAQDEMAIAFELAVRGVPDSEAILTGQLARLQNPDRRARFSFVTPALSPDPIVRDAFFDRLRDPANRRSEPWVLEGVAFLNHPLRAPRSERYVLPALELLEQVQRTGDIFFPRRWLDATLGGHQSPAAAAIVQMFLSVHPDYPIRLKRIILQAADGLFRASQMT